MKISADLIDLEMAAEDPDASPPDLDHELALGDGDSSDSKAKAMTQYFSILKNQILQLFHLDSSECHMEITYKRQDNKVTIDSDKALKDAIEYADGNRTTFEIKIDCEKGATAKRTSNDSGIGALKIQTRTDSQMDKSSRLDCDEEELAWAKQHGWVRALIQEVEGKVLDTTMAQLTEMLKDGLTLNPPKEKKARKLEHPGFKLVCNVCATNILGPHYKCSVCKDFDLCLRCETIPNIHNKSHPLLKIRLFDARPHVQKNYKKSLEVAPNKNNAPSTGLKRKHEKINKSEKKSAGGSSSHKKYDAKSITYNHFFTAEPGQTFTDIWILENCGLRNWKNHVFLKYCGNDPNIIPSRTMVPINTSESICVPGKQIEIEVSCTILSSITPGTYAIPWRLTRKGEDFGPIYSTIVNVVSPNEDTPRKMPKVKKCSLAETPQKEAIAEVLTAAVAANEETCNQGAKPKIFVSSTNTPNNTPFVLSPPKSPEPPILAHPSAIPLEQSGPSFMQEDAEAQSCGSTSESDSEFVVIPIPPSSFHSEAMKLEMPLRIETLDAGPRKESVSSIATYSLSECSTPEMLEYEGSLASVAPQEKDKDADQIVPDQTLSQKAKTEDISSFQDERKDIKGPPVKELEDDPPLAASAVQETLQGEAAEAPQKDNSSLLSKHSENTMSTSPKVECAAAEAPASPHGKVVDNSFITDVKTCFTASVYPSLAEMSASDNSLTAPCFLPQPQNFNVSEASLHSEEADENSAVPQILSDPKPQNVSQASQTCPNTNTTYTQVPQESVIQVLPISMVSGVASQVLSTAKAVISGIQHLGPPTSLHPQATTPKEAPQQQPPSSSANNAPTTTPSEDLFVYPPEAWIGNEMTPQEYQYFEWKFASTIQNFHEMGFYDQIRIERLLKKFNGDIHKVADALLRNPSEDPDNNWFTTRHGSAPAQPHGSSFDHLDFD